MDAIRSVAITTPAADDRLGRSNGGRQSNARRRRTATAAQMTIAGPAHHGVETMSDDRNATLVSSRPATVRMIAQGNASRSLSQGTSSEPLTNPNR